MQTAAHFKRLAHSVPWAALLKEAALLAAVYYGFSLAKNLIHRHPEEVALRNALDLLRLEKGLGLFREASFQGWLMSATPWAVNVFNVVYTLFYTPAVLLSAMVGRIVAPARYRRFRNAAFLVLGVALAVFAFFPLAPPRMVPGLGIVDTMRAGQPIDYGEGAHILTANRYAAMPSVHYAMTLLVALAWASTGMRWVMVAAFLYQALMLAAVLATGNHYFLDVLGSMGAVALAWGVHYALGFWRRLQVGSARGRP